jgi:DHA1 family inner membrane transport protein
MAVFALTAASPVMAVASLVLMGGFGFATVPGLQMRIMTYAGSAPTLASGANIAAFNIGNAAGAWLGGLTISAGLGYASTIWDGAALSLGALVVLLVADRLARRQHTHPAATSPQPLQDLTDQDASDPAKTGALAR